MAYTVNQLVVDIQEAYNDCTDAKAIRLVNQALGTLMQDVDANANTETNTSVVAGTHTYTLTKSYGKIVDVSWITSATSAKSLIAWSAAEYDSLLRGLRSYDPTSGTPTHYFIEPRMATLGTHPITTGITFYPNPSTSTTGGYPKFSVTGTAHVLLVAGDSLPDYVLDPEWLKEEACWKLAIEAGKYEEAKLRRQIAYDLRTRQARVMTSVQARTCQHLDFPFSGGDATF